MVSKFRYIISIPQTTTLTPFRIPIPVSSGFIKFGFDHQKSMKMRKLLTSSFMTSAHANKGSKWICRANQLTGFYMMATLTFKSQCKYLH